MFLPTQLRAVSGSLHLHITNFIWKKMQSITLPLHSAVWGGRSNFLQLQPLEQKFLVHRTDQFYISLSAGDNFMSCSITFLKRERERERVLAACKGTSLKEPSVFLAHVTSQYPSHISFPLSSGFKIILSIRDCFLLLLFFFFSLAWVCFCHATFSHHSQASNKPVSEVMDTWTRQMGYPVLEMGSNSVLTQKRFLLDPNADASDPPSDLG